MYHATWILLLGAVIHADTFGDTIFVDAALLSSAAMFLGAKVILQGHFVIKQNIDGVLNVQLFNGFLFFAVHNLLNLFGNFALTNGQTLRHYDLSKESKCLNVYFTFFS